VRHCQHRPLPSAAPPPGVAGSCASTRTSRRCAARRRAVTRGFQHSYRRWRPMVERSIAWLVADRCRRVPYHGIQRNDLWWSLPVAAVNLRRLLVLGLAATTKRGSWLEAGGHRPG
jgi:hypothetical protein